MGEFVDEYIGVVEDVDLDKANGRCKIRVFGVFGHYQNDKNKIPTDKLPWAYPKSPLQFSSKNGSGQLSIPKKNTRVKVTFESGDHMHPRYTSIEEIDPTVIDKAKEEPDNFHSFFWDTDQDFKFYFTKGSGLMLDYKDSLINIQPNGTILIDNRNSESTIELQGGTCTIVTNTEVKISATNQITHNAKKVHVNGEDTYVGHNPVYAAVMGEILYKALAILASGLDKKYPTTPGVFANLIKALKDPMLSETVKVSH
jgi:hypothetical protein